MTKTEAQQTIQFLGSQSIIRFLANATATYYSAGGHGKAAQNKVLCEVYKAELLEREVDIPSIDELLKVGEFNGEGSN